MNLVVISGRLARDCEVLYTEQGIAFMRNAVAVDRDYVKKGENRKADWIDIEIWRNTAEFVSKYFTTGSPILLQGWWKVESYTDKEGIKRTSNRLVVDKAFFFKSDNRAHKETQSEEPEFSVVEPDDSYIFGGVI